MTEDETSRRALLVFTKPARAGRVKTRLIGDLTPEQAAEIHAAFRDDLCERLQRGQFHLEISWALDPGEEVPVGLVSSTRPVPGKRQHEGDLGARLFHALREASDRFEVVAAVGSDHPELTTRTVEEAFQRLEAGADLVLGPVPDGGYFLIGLRAGGVHQELFEGMAWSTETVLSDTLARAERLGLATEMLAEGQDIDRPEDLAELVRRLDGSEEGAGPRTRALLESWERLTSPSPKL